MPKPAGMTNKKIAFCKEYVKANCSNAMQAAIAAGYSPVTARADAHKLLYQPEIKRYIEHLNEIGIHEAGIDLGWALAEWRLLYNKCKGQEKYLEAIRILENISKHLGFYAKDNAQKDPVVTINISQMDIIAISQRLEESC